MPSTRADIRTEPEPSRSPFFLADSAELRHDHLVLRGPEGRHATTVRRLVQGEHAYLTDGAGSVAHCVVTALRPGELELDVLTRQSLARPSPSLAVVQAVPKGDRGELAVELLTEVGTDVIIPWAAQRCVAQWRGERAAKSLARWRSTAVQAGKQSRRAWLPEVTPLADLAAVAGRVREAGLAVLLDPDAPARLADLRIPSTGEIVLVVGPEGGVTPAEREALAAAGAVGARLGPTVLRASSAGVVAAGIVLSASVRW
jgi:16S rRNA (uracil1498-N3)-methyltransferase